MEKIHSEYFDYVKSKKIIIWQVFTHRDQDTADMSQQSVLNISEDYN